MLANSVQESWPFNYEDKIDLFAEISQGLSYCHDQIVLGEGVKEMEDLELFQSILHDCDQEDKNEEIPVEQEVAMLNLGVYCAEEDIQGKTLKHQNRKQKRIVKQKKPFVIEYRPRGRPSKKSQKQIKQTCVLPEPSQAVKLPIRVQSDITNFWRCQQHSQNSTVNSPDNLKQTDQLFEVIDFDYGSYLSLE